MESNNYSVIKYMQILFNWQILHLNGSLKMKTWKNLTDAISSILMLQSETTFPNVSLCFFGPQVRGKCLQKFRLILRLKTFLNFML